MSSTICPISDLTLVDLHNEAIGYKLECDADSPFRMCPPVLFREITKINYIRRQASIGSDLVATESLSHQAYEVRNRVQSFPTEGWAASKPQPTSVSGYSLAICIGLSWHSTASCRRRALPSGPARRLCESCAKHCGGGYGPSSKRSPCLHPISYSCSGRWSPSV